VKVPVIVEVTVIEGDIVIVAEGLTDGVPVRVTEDGRRARAASRCASQSSSSKAIRHVDEAVELDVGVDE